MVHMVTPPRALLFDADGVLQRTAPWREDLGDLVGDENEEIERLPVFWAAPPKLPYWAPARLRYSRKEE